MARNTLAPGGYIGGEPPRRPYFNQLSGVWKLEDVVERQKAGLWANPVGIEDLFSTWLYTGNGSTQTITNGIDLAGEGGLVWMKSRSTAGNSYTVFNDAGTLKDIYTNGTVGAGTATWTSWNNNGFSLSGVTNDNATTYASWTFRKAPGFFDVVTYTGTGSAQNISHNLGSVPGCIIVKRTDASTPWAVAHRGTSNYSSGTDGLNLNTTDAVYSGTVGGWWNSTGPTSTQFSVGNYSETNASGGTYVAYLFAHDAQIFGDAGDQSVIKCGSYTGSTYPVDLGWEPQFLLQKRVDTTGDWILVDTMRGWHDGGADNTLFPNLANAEATNINYYTPRSTGFDTGLSGTYIYIAIRRGPMRAPTSGTEVFAVDLGLDAGTSSTPSATAGFPVDMGIITSRTSADNRFIASRLTAGNVMYTEASFAENTNSIWSFSYQSGFATFAAASADRFAWMFRRAPGFFDVVAYTGTFAARTIAHNLGVAPELMIVRQRNATRDWNVYSAGVAAPATSLLRLNTTGAVITGVTQHWNATSPTASVFSVGSDFDVNQSGGTYVAYLFTTLPGISKVGSYTGTGTTLNVDCGFTSGARFVMIKRTDSTGDWYIWDTARGIVAGNDPYLLLNSTAAENTSTDYIDPYSGGFEISSTAPAAINASGGSFIYLAIA